MMEIMRGSSPLTPAHTLGQPERERFSLVVSSGRDFPVVGWVDTIEDDPGHAVRVESLASIVRIVSRQTKGT